MTRAVAVTATALGNLARLVLLSAGSRWRRNLGTTSPVLATLGLLLVATGVFAILWRAFDSVVKTEAGSASVLHVYLADGATPDAVDGLVRRLGSDPRVLSVEYVSSDDALRRARSRPGLGLLLEGDDGNPFPAQLDVRVQSIRDVSGVASSLSGADGVDPVYPTSYDGAAYQRLEAAFRYARLGGAIILALLLAVALVVSANSVRASLLARRDEIRILWLVGSPAWVIRLPFVVEGAITGAFAGVGGGFLVALGFMVAARTQPVTVAQFLPGVDIPFALALGAAIVGLGMAVGSGSTVLGLRGLKR